MESKHRMLQIYEQPRKNRPESFKYSPYTLIRTEDKSALASPFPKIQDKKSADNPLFHHQKTIKMKENKFFFAKY